MIDRQQWKGIKRWKRKNEDGQDGWKPKVRGGRKKEYELVEQTDNEIERPAGVFAKEESIKFQDS